MTPPLRMCFHLLLAAPCAAIASIPNIIIYGAPATAGPFALTLVILWSILALINWADTRHQTRRERQLP